MSTLKFLVRGAAVSAIALSAAGLASAQVTTSGVRGNVVDADNQPVVGATVTVTDPSTGFARSAVTTASGQYSLRGLPVASDYVVTVEAGEFASQSIEDVALFLGDATQLNFSLASGDARTLETVVVTGSALDMIEVATGPSATFGAETLQNAPTVNRNIVDVLRLDPRVYVDESRGGINPVQCAGKNPRFNSFTLDGVRLNDGFGLNANGYPTERQPFPYDAVEQVAVELAPFDVEYGGFTACNINAVTKSGSNEFHGVAFYDYTSDGLQGDSIEGNDRNLADFDEKRYGLQVSGPIVRDTLFFSAAYEKLDGVNNFGGGALSDGNITQTELDRIVDISNTLYSYDPGEQPQSFDNFDEKFLLKLDWNINNQHRAAFTYNYNDGNNIVASDGDNDEYEFSNHLYERGAELNQYVGQFYSDWTNNFSTEVRLGYVDLANRQLSLGGTDFGEIRVETDNADVYIGGDDSRQSNVLSYDIWNFAAKGFYQMGDHNLTFGYEREAYDIFNLFVQHSETEIRFGSIDDFEAGTPYAIYYNNAPSNNPTDAAADWGYAVNSLYFQDEFDLQDNLTIVLGARYDFWATDDAPAENATFLADYGFSNSATLDGKSLFQPRFAFTWDAKDNVTVRGGVGRYSGGDPNVWLSNTYSANNVLQFGQRGRSFGYTDGSRTLFDTDIVWEGCEAGVPSGPGYCVPGELYDAVAGGVGDNFEINYLDPDFEIPSEWKIALGATWIPNVAIEGPMGGEYVVNADLLISKGENSAMIKRGDLEEVGRTADGYPIYDSVREAAFVLTNAKNVANESTTVSLSVAKDYDNGFDWSVGYSWNDSKDVQPMTSSVAFSNYINRAFFDPQEEVLSTSNYNTEHRFVAFTNYEREFFGEYATRFSAVGLLNSGRPYSFAYNGTINPYGFTPYLDFADNVLSPGAERNGEEGSWWGKMDVRVEQELPGFMEEHRTSAFLAIDNFTNLLNDEWGVLRQPGFPQTVNETDLRYESVAQDASAYEIRFGLKYTF